MVIVAQLVRAPDCGSGGRRFEPDLSPHLNADVGTSAFFLGCIFYDSFSSVAFFKQCPFSKNFRYCCVKPRRGIMVFNSLLQ